MTKSFGKKVFYILLSIFVVGFFVLFWNDVYLHFGAPGKAGYAGQKIKDIKGELYIAPKYIFDWYTDQLMNVDDRLYMEIYNFTYDKLIDIFSYLNKEGVDVDIVMEKNQYKQGSGNFNNLKQELTGKNIDITSDKSMDVEFLHSKFLVLDDKFMIQTANLNYSSFFNNREYFFVSENKGVLDSLIKIFKKDKRGMPVEEEDIHNNLLVCDINCRNRIEKYLKSAEKSIHIQTQSITDKNVLNILDKKQDKLDLKLMTADLDSNKKLESKFKEDIKIFDEHYLHAKSILIDEKFLILGSINLTSNSMDNNREVSIILINDKIINKYLRNFKEDWKES